MHLEFKEGKIERIILEEDSWNVDVITCIDFF